MAAIRNVTQFPRHMTSSPHVIYLNVNIFYGTINPPGAITILLKSRSYGQRENPKNARYEIL